LGENKRTEIDKMCDVPNKPVTRAAKHVIPTRWQLQLLSEAV